MKTESVIRAIEIIGEAVKNIPDTIRKENPDIPWKQLAGMRDKLIHGYFGVDIIILWKAATEELPKLKSPFLKILDTEIMKRNKGEIYEYKEKRKIEKQSGLYPD